MRKNLYTPVPLKTDRATEKEYRWPLVGENAAWLAGSKKIMRPVL
jgi:hypothetical protein